MSRQRVWITGASQGLGKALAEQYLARGAQVAVSARSKPELQAAFSGYEAGDCLICPLDITDGVAVRRTAQEIEDVFGGLECVILNAGQHAETGSFELADGTARQLMEVNFFGQLNCLRTILPLLQRQGSGTIVFVSSLAAYRGLPYAALYGASKAALSNLAESIRPELAAAGIDVRLVSPGFIRTRLTDRNTFEMPSLMEPDAAAKALVAGLESKRFEVRFPFGFSLAMKSLALLPYGLFFRLTGRLLRET